MSQTTRSTDPDRIDPSEPPYAYWRAGDDATCYHPTNCNHVTFENFRRMNVRYIRTFLDLDKCEACARREAGIKQGTSGKKAHKECVKCGEMIPSNKLPKHLRSEH